MKLVNSVSRLLRRLGRLLWVGMCVRAGRPIDAMAKGKWKAIGGSWMLIIVANPVMIEAMARLHSWHGAGAIGKKGGRRRRRFKGKGKYIPHRHGMEINAWKICMRILFSSYMLAWFASLTKYFYHWPKFLLAARSLDGIFIHLISDWSPSGADTGRLFTFSA